MNDLAAPARSKLSAATGDVKWPMPTDRESFPKSRVEFRRGRDKATGPR